MAHQLHMRNQISLCLHFRIGREYAMFIQTSLNLDTQIQYLGILRGFLDSEHKALQYGEVYDVFQAGKAIHGILETVRQKREELAQNLMGADVRSFASELPDAMGNCIRMKLDRLAGIERDCLNRTSRNADLSMALAGYEPADLELWNVFTADATAEGRVQ